MSNKINCNPLNLAALLESKIVTITESDTQTHSTLDSQQMKLAKNLTRCRQPTLEKFFKLPNDTPSSGLLRQGLLLLCKVVYAKSVAQISSATAKNSRFIFNRISALLNKTHILYESLKRSTSRCVQTRLERADA
ncbi:hypothetical protein BaRGS_00027994 [Batillaria attramentaria]|uniref:Uncharacterized protein n=1 Tax=Batillaria attramentaria TaxID=370345 RepID=A0ABD0K1K7_9CAEN